MSSGNPGEPFLWYTSSVLESLEGAQAIWRAGKNGKELLSININRRSCYIQ